MFKLRPLHISVKVISIWEMSTCKKFKQSPRWTVGMKCAKDSQLDKYYENAQTKNKISMVNSNA